MRRRRRRAGLLGAGLAGCLVLAAGAALQGGQTTDEQLAVERFNRGLGLLDQLQFGEAADVFEALADAWPGFVAARVNQGIALYYQRRSAEAERVLRQALEVQQDQPNAHYLLGLIAADDGRPEEARDRFESVLRHDPDDASTHYYLGRLAMELRRYATAAGHFREVITLEPYNASAHYNLATALLRLGDQPAARTHMLEFQRLQGLFGSRTMGLNYLEQGPFAAPVDELPAAFQPDLPSEERFAVRFIDIAADAGLDFRHGGGAGGVRQVEGRDDLERRFVPWIGSGLAFGDYDGDGRDDLFVADAGGSSPSGRLFRNRGGGRFEDVTSETGLAAAGPTMHPLWGDLDGDGRLDLYLINYGPNRFLRQGEDGGFEEQASSLGIDDGGWGLGGALVDFDHDGDLDIYVANFVEPDAPAGTQFPEGFRGAANVLYRNNGNGTFTDVSGPSGLADTGRSTAVVAADFDASRDVDFFVVNLEGGRLYENRRDGTFAAAQDRGAGGAALGLAVGTIAGDTDFDIFLAGSDSRLLVNRGPARFRQGEAPSDPAHGAQLLDVDNDGDLDLLTLDGLRLGVEGGSETAGLRLFENRSGTLVEATAEAGLNAFRDRAVRGFSASDIDDDGDLDLAVSVNGGRPLLLRNDGGNRRHWLDVVLRPVNSSPSGIGTRVEVLAGRLRQRRQVTAGSGFMSSLPPTVHFGLGERTRIDALRLLWPNGVLQTEIDEPGIDRRRSVTELNRKGTSCPLLYVWDGQRFTFQTDFLGGSAFGYQLAPGVFNFPDTDEFIKLERENVALVDGRVAITLNNQLEEVIFFDRLQLVAVDHPPNYEIFPDEKLLPGPPYAPFTLVTAADPRPPISAVDGHGRDQLPALLAVDRRYADIGPLLPFKGYAGDHELVLDLGQTGDGEVWLLADAWIDYADSTANVAAAQAGLALRPPVVDVQDDAGHWVTVEERMGFPAGLPKKMTIDLTGRFRSTSRKIRIRTNMRIHWDRIQVVAEPQRNDFVLRRVEAESARLSVHGFPKVVLPDGREPRIYLHEETSATASWKVHPGAYTRLGEVGPLLTETDDRYVITRSGDQIEARFDVSALPPPPPGWVRDYLVFVDGFGKDMDLNSAAPDAIGPLPFHAMRAFPYPSGQRYPDSEAQRRYLEEWNTRLVEEALPPLEQSKDGRPK